MTDDFDAAEWLKRAEAYGYEITLSPDVAGRLGISRREPVGGRPEGDPDPVYELTAVPGRHAALHEHLLALGRIWHVPWSPTQKAIIRQMKRRGLLYPKRNEITGLRTKDVLEVAGELGMIIMGIEPPPLRGRAER